MPYSPASVIRYRPRFSPTVPPGNVIIYFEEPDFKPWEIRKSILVQYGTYHRQNQEFRYLETIYRDVRLLRRLTQAFAEQVGKLTKRFLLLHVLPYVIPFDLCPFTQFITDKPSSKVPYVASCLLLILTYDIKPPPTPEPESNFKSFLLSSKPQFQPFYYLHYVLLPLPFVPCAYASWSFLKAYELPRQLKMIEKLNGELTMLENHKGAGTDRSRTFLC